MGLALHPTRSANHNTRWMVGASNKPFDYMANGLALLVSDVAEWRQTFVGAGYGIASDPDDPASLANALHWLAEHPAETRAMGERGRQQIANCWNYETAVRASHGPTRRALRKSKRGEGLLTLSDVSRPTRIAIKRALYPGFDLHTRCRYRYMPRSVPGWPDRHAGRRLRQRRAGVRRLQTRESGAGHQRAGRRDPSATRNTSGVSYRTATDSSSAR